MPLGSSARQLFALALSLAIVGCGRAETGSGSDMAHAPQSGTRLSLGRVLPRDAGLKVVVESEAVGPGGAIARRYSAYGDNRSPPLAWTAVPHAAAYAVIVEDPDAPGAAPFVHWLIWNIPGADLPEGVGRGARPAGVPGAAQGRNSLGQPAYFGPRPPAGTGVHHYHVQVFALDAPLPLDGGADLHELVAALQGHVLADGELVGTFAAP